MKKLLYVLCLLLGNGLFSLLQSCDGHNDLDQVLINLEFVNNTDYTIQYSNIFVIEPDQVEFISFSREISKSETFETCCDYLLEDFQGSAINLALTLDDSLCVYHNDGDGPTNLQNYQRIKLAERHFLFRYVFTESNIGIMERCP